MGHGLFQMVTVIWGLGGPVSTLKFSDIRNLLLRTSPRFFTRSERNHCRNILWKVNINNYQKKVEISTQFRNGAPKRSKVEGQFYEKGYNMRTKWDIFTKLKTHICEYNLWSNKKKLRSFATWWRCNKKTAITTWPLVRSTWKLVCNVLVRSGTSVYEDIRLSKKTWPPLAKQS